MRMGDKKSECLQTDEIDEVGGQKTGMGRRRVGEDKEKNWGNGDWRLGASEVEDF